MEENSKSFANHNVIIDSRKKLSLSGISDVISFDDETIILDSSMGRITVKGEDLKIASFDNLSGDLSAEGKIFAVVYNNDDKASEGFFSRLFK